MRIGLLLPHFGQLATMDVVLETAQRADQLGFDSLWVRDHLVFQPHEFEGSSSKFFEPFMTLAAVAAVVKKAKVGTCVAIPVRHPLAIAQAFITLSHLAPNRVIAGIGAGNARHEFEAVGWDYEKRTAMLEDAVEILPQAFSGQSFAFEGAVFQIPQVQFDPGAAEQIPVLVGGNAPAAARRSLRADGWLPGRLPVTTFEQRVKTIGAKRREANKPKAMIGAMPLIRIATTREQALERVNLQGILASANKASYWVKPASGSFETYDDVRGMVLAGSSADILEDIHDYERLGTNFLIFDLRSSFDELADQMHLIAEEVISKLPGDQ